MKPAAILLVASCSLAVSQTLSLRDQLSPQALQLARADYATMSATPTAHSAQISAESDIEAKLFDLAQSEIDAEGDRFTDKSPGADDMKLYYLLRMTRVTKWALAIVGQSGKPDNRLLGKAVSCDLLMKVTLQMGKLQAWRAPCLDLPSAARLQEVNVAQQKLIDELRSQVATKP